ncbi:MAG: PLP-dependent transferase, partial [bacterium]
QSTLSFWRDDKKVTRKEKYESSISNMMSLLKAGDEILCNADIYGGMYRILSKVAVRQGIKVRFIPLW